MRNRFNKHTNEYFTKKFNELMYELKKLQDFDAKYSLSPYGWTEYEHIETKIEILKYEAETYNGLILG